PSSTLCVHAGEGPDATTGAVEPPLHLSSAYAFESAEQAAGAFAGDNEHLIYGRWRNPTVEGLEQKVAALEGGKEAVATASGMAAICAALLSLCEAGDAIVAPQS